MHKPPNSEATQVPSPKTLAGVPLLDKVFEFIIKQFSKQPAWLRAFVYFLFVVFFITTASRLIGGRYAVKGVVWNGDQYAQNCEIRLNGEYFSTNSRGEYHAVFTPTQYYSLLLKQSMVLLVVSAGRRDHSYPVSLNILEDQLDDIILGKGFVAPSEHSLNFAIISSAYAQEPSIPRGADRIYVDQLILSAEAKNVRYLELQMGLKGQINPRVRNLGEEAGKLPIRGAGRVTLPSSSYYFDVPHKFRDQPVTIEINGSAGFLRSFHETFKFIMPSQAKSYQAPGDKGGVIQLHAVLN
jgi:hypothetical protein